MLAALARMQGMASQDADTCGAYTQNDFKGDETWAELPPHQWPNASHGKYKRPVVTLMKALYGHPKAGLYGAQHCKAALLKCGVGLVVGWECLYNNLTKGVSLSMCVDEFRIGGFTHRLAVYIRTRQHEVPPDLELVAALRELYTTLCTQHDADLQRSAKCLASPLRA